MSRKNRNARHQTVKPMNTGDVQISMDKLSEKNNTICMLDSKCGYEFTRLPSTMLDSDTTYQRPIDLKRVQRIVENYDSRLVNPLKVSSRDGHYYVFDGAHTLAVLKKINQYGSFMVPCIVYHCLSYEDEAYLFALQRGDSKEVAAAARIKALILSNDTKAADFRKRTEEAGFRLSNSHWAGSGNIACIDKLWRIYESDPKLYSEVLSLLMDCWHGDRWSLAANIVGGMSVFIKTYRGQYSRERFLRNVGCADLAALNKCKPENGKKDFVYAYAMLKMYNKGGRGALEPYGLYDHQ